jgi:uncharacterized protein (TIGR03086 family)
LADRDAPLGADRGQEVTPMELDAFAEIATRFGDPVVGTPLEALERPTPCTESTVRLLLKHVITGSQRFTSVIEDTAAPDRTIDQVLADPATAFGRRNGEFRAAIGQPGALDQDYRLPSGEVRGPRYLPMRANEYMVHGWDLAQATGQVAAFPDASVLGPLAAFRDVFAGQVRVEGRGFGLEVPVAADAAPLDRLVALFARML